MIIHINSVDQFNKEIKEGKVLVDFFATWYKGNVYLIPVEECSGAEKAIRIIPPKNGQIKGINFAKDYLAQEVLKKL